jgi:hypothetical protein
MPSTSFSACQHLKQEKQHLGVDPQRGRHADVWLKSCPDCHRHWIHYYFEYEYLIGRGRIRCAKHREYREKRSSVRFESSRAIAPIQDLTPNA